MITEITIEGLVTYDNEFDLWRVDDEAIETTISDFENRKVVVTITEI
jgi:hypothetical protein